MSDKVGASARVTLQLEISLGQAWGETCDLAQVHRQAEREALDMITTGKLTPRNSRVIGRPVVDVVIARKTS
jgi:hypothetical protein